MQAEAKERKTYQQRAPAAIWDREMIDRSFVRSVGHPQLSMINFLDQRAAAWPDCMVLRMSIDRL